MRREDCLDIFQRLPEALHNSVNLVLRNQFVIAVDMVARFEPHYLVLRGREGGSTDEGRGFFIPYDEIAYIRIERTVKVGELKRYYGETGYIDKEELAEAGPQQTSERQVAAPAGAGSVVVAEDPAAIARQNLLERIRATRANLGGTTSRLNNKTGS
ncbi:MAG: hypothetical protein NZ703_10580 [Gemmataceae bacterium]|nr:hypothetical protein [Gemmataceae bacterium]MCS7271521.1 hypothetical protein [Gemmataceae bacterium]MDW8243344.1 hypothetical protein [Thermogemmata sp.]